MTEIVAADIGGTNARFAIARIEGDDIRLGEPAVFPSADHAGLEAAWTMLPEAFGRPLPRKAAIAVAAPIEGDTLRFVNSDWTIERSGLADRLGLDRLHVLNDFGAMAYGVDALESTHGRHLMGPDQLLPKEAPVTVIGPGTGLGCAILLRRDRRVNVIETEAGHVSFAPLDAAEAAMMPALRERFGRVSSERLAAGPGLSVIREMLSPGSMPVEDAELWASALDADPDAAPALARYFMILGAVAGDVALAHGAMGVALVGGIANRAADFLLASDFHARFVDKGRYEDRMRRIPIRLITHPNAGLVGAAAAFASLESERL